MDVNQILQKWVQRQFRRVAMRLHRT